MCFQSLVIRFCLLSAIVFQNAHAYSWKKCKQNLLNQTDTSGILAVTSTTQYVSSFGPCSALGLNAESERERYYAVNEDKIRSEIAKGTGENLKGFLRLSACTEDRFKGLALLLKSQFRYLPRDTFEAYRYLKNKIETSC